MKSSREDRIAAGATLVAIGAFALSLRVPSWNGRFLVLMCGATLAYAWHCIRSVRKRREARLRARGVPRPTL